MKKKILAIILSVVIPLCSVSMVFATEDELGGFDPGTATVITEECLRNAYEVSVIEQMAGRCGAATVTGAKGIVFEILANDKINLENLFDKEFTSSLSVNPNAQLADLVILDSLGNEVGYYQCKSATSTSGIRTIFSQVSNGKYDGATLIGTRESSEAYNAFASANGASSSMVDSEISNDNITRIAEKSLHYSPSITTAAKMGLKTGAFAAGINSVISLVECIIHQKSFCQSVGKVSVQTIKGFVTGYGTGFLVEITGTALSAAGFGTVSMIIIPAVVSIGAGILTCYVLDSVIKETDVENRIAELTEAFGTKIQTAIQKAREIIQNSSAFIGCVAEDVSESVTYKVFPSIKNAIDNALIKLKSCFSTGYTKN